MTNKEAIFVLKKELDGIPSDLDKSALEKAVNLAIKALEPVGNSDNLTTTEENSTVGDLISRSELAHHKFLTPDNPDYSKRFDENIIAYQKGWNDAIDAIIDNAPTVEPTFKSCVDCKDFGKLCETCEVNDNDG